MAQLFVLLSPQVILELLENEYQNDNFQPLIDTIRKSSTNPDDQAIVAISLVQHMPYNWNGFYGSSMDWYYPYETLYNNKGVTVVKLSDFCIVILNCCCDISRTKGEYTEDSTVIFGR